jgi:hypothetical protein
MTYPEQHIQELVKTINTLRAERDEARREVCRDEAYRMDPLYLHLTPQGVAEHRGWDCYKEDTDER